MTKEKSFAERRKEFIQWHKDNPLMWEYFEQFSIEAVNSGF